MNELDKGGERKCDHRVLGKQGCALQTATEPTSSVRSQSSRATGGSGTMTQAFPIPDTI